MDNEKIKAFLEAKILECDSAFIKTRTTDNAYNQIIGERSAYMQILKFVISLRDE